MRTRRVGTFTLGITLIGTGVMYLFYLFIPKAVNLMLMMRLWPTILIVLGGEVLVSYFINRDEKLHYDGWAVFLIVCLVGFAWCLAAGEFLMAHYGVYCDNQWYY